ALNKASGRTFDNHNNPLTATDELNHTAQYGYTYYTSGGIESDAIKALTVTQPHAPGLADTNFQTITYFDRFGQVTNTASFNSQLGVWAQSGSTYVDGTESPASDYVA